MTNLAKTINAYLKDNINDLKIFNDLFPDDKTEGVIAIHDPATRKVTTFIDGTQELQINISYTARYKNAKKCREVLTSILELLDGCKLIDTEDNTKVKTEAIANAQFLATDDKNNSIYTASINAVYNSN